MTENRKEFYPPISRVLQLIDEAPVDAETKDRLYDLLLEIVNFSKRKLERENRTLTQAERRDRIIRIASPEQDLYPNEVRDIVSGCLRGYARNIPVDHYHGLHAHKRKDDVVQDIITVNELNECIETERPELIRRIMDRFQLDHNVRQCVAAAGKMTSCDGDTLSCSDAFIDGSMKELAESFLALMGVNIIRGRNAYKIDYYNDPRYRTFVKRTHPSS